MTDKTGMEGKRGFMNSNLTTAKTMAPGLDPDGGPNVPGLI
ncbi:hypothetical protein ACLD02_10300 [Alloalcanivorax sp. C16-2]|nr:hypothetical protein [Alloalcanivorax marinus]